MASRTERILALGAALVLAAGLVGCGGSYKGMPAGSFERGKAQFDDEKYYESVEDLRLFIRRSPTDPRAPEAQYLIGMARYNDEDYAVAAVEFEILRKDYPTSELVDDAWYMQGMCYVEQVPRIDLDQTVTHQAVDHFNRYLREYPGGEHRPEVEEELRKLNRHLDEKELKAARLYRRLKQWTAAAVTVDALIESRPDSELRPEALLLAGEVHSRQLDSDAALRAYRTFLADYPDHPRAKEARRGIERIEGKAGAGEGR